jgi:ankyrin repeat protein
MECILEYIAKNAGNFKKIVDIQDIHGDTALNLAARIGARHLVDQLLEVGANTEIENLAGLKASSFGFGKSQGQGGSSQISAPETSMGAPTSTAVQHSSSLSARVVFPSIATNDEQSSTSASHSRQGETLLADTIFQLPNSSSIWTSIAITYCSRRNSNPTKRAYQRFSGPSKAKRIFERAESAHP